jgi:hypothetical protein
MRGIQFDDDSQDIEVHVRVPTPRTSTITAALITAVAVILAALIPFVIANNGSSTQSSVSTSTPEQPATALIEEYFSDINNKDYQAAYNLWKHDSQTQSVASFTKGYASTLNDAVTVEGATVLDDGTIKVFVTLKATDKLPSGTGTKTSVFKGYYIVGPQNGALKILSGQLK